MLQRGLWVRNWLISIKLSTPHSSMTTYRMTADMARRLIPWLLIFLLVAGFQDSDPGADVWQCLLQTGNQLFPLYRKNPHALLPTLQVTDPDPVSDPYESLVSKVSNPFLYSSIRSESRCSDYTLILKKTY